MAVFNKSPESKFVYVMVAARRARQLQEGAPALTDSRSRKPTRIAREELTKGLLEYEVPEVKETEEEKEAKRRK